MQAHIITIGDEILIGQIVDTNSAWMAQQLNLQGIAVKEIVSANDDRQHILSTFADAENRADIILITGGLGPTKDDITKTTLCEYFGTELVWNEAIWQNIVHLFSKFNRTPAEIQRTQAHVPANATVLINKVGTASGMWFEREGKVFVSMPGVPFEMQYLMEKEVLPRLKERFQGLPIAHRTILTAGIGESDLAALITDLEEALPPFVKLAYLPSLGQVRLRLTGRHEDAAFLENYLTERAADFQKRVQEHVFGTEKETLETVVGDILRQKGHTLGLAESCTGGYLAHLFTANAGSSDFFTGSIVAYSNIVKQNVLGVSSETLDSFGAVSEECVREMAAGARRVLGVDYAISVSGIAGPGGGTPEKPVGTIWFAIASKEKTVAFPLKFGRDRLKNIQLTTVFVLNTFRKFLIAE